MFQVLMLAMADQIRIRTQRKCHICLKDQSARVIEYHTESQIWTVEWKCNKCGTNTSKHTTKELWELLHTTR